jgi:hypothetical protein
MGELAENAVAAFVCSWFCTEVDLSSSNRLCPSGRKICEAVLSPNLGDKSATQFYRLWGKTPHVPFGQLREPQISAKNAGEGMARGLRISGGLDSQGQAEAGG